MQGKLKKLSLTLSGILKARGLESRVSEYRILGKWEKTVGRAIALHARPVKLQGKKLFLIVDSPAWMQQLSLLKPEIIEKLNAQAGRPAVADIALRIGEIAAIERNPDVPPALAPLDENDYALIEDCIKDIRDPQTKSAVRRVIEKDFQAKKGIKK